MKSTRFTAICRLMLLIASSFFFSNANAVELFESDSTCCDSIELWQESDSTLSDTCKGTVYFKLPADTNCIIRSVKSSGTDSLIYDSLHQAFGGRYAVSKGQTGIVYGYFLNEFGDTVCTKSLTIRCPNCCDSSMVYYLPDSAVTDSCAGYVYFKYDTLCSITTIHAANLQPGSYLIWDASAHAWKARYSLAKGDSRTFTGYFTNGSGDTVCTQSITIDCPMVCCDMIQFIDYPEPSAQDEPCCGDMHIDFPEACNITYVSITDLSNYGGVITQTGPFTFHYCIPTGFYLNWTIAFYDSDGNLLCEKTFAKECTILGKKGASGKGVSMGQPGIKVYPNPANNQVTVDIPSSDGKEGIIRILDMKGSVMAIYPISGSVTKTTLPLEGTPDGVYMLEYTNESVTSRSKLVITR